jgi:hypothetical protein
MFWTDSNAKEHCCPMERPPFRSRLLRIAQATMESIAQILCHHIHPTTTMFALRVSSNFRTIVAVRLAARKIVSTPMFHNRRCHPHPAPITAFDPEYGIYPWYNAGGTLEPSTDDYFSGQAAERITAGTDYGNPSWGHSNMMSSIPSPLMAATEFLGDWSLGTSRVRSRRTDPAGLVEFVPRGLVGQYTERGCCSLVFLSLPTMKSI